MKPVTQILRAFIEPDPSKPRKARTRSVTGSPSELVSTPVAEAPSELVSTPVAETNTEPPVAETNTEPPAAEGDPIEATTAEDEDEEIFLTPLQLAMLEESARLTAEDAALRSCQDAEDEEIFLTPLQMAMFEEMAAVQWDPSGDPQDSAYKRQKADMDKIRSLLGPDASPWFGPMLIVDCETTTGIGQKLRFGVFQDRGHNYREVITLARRPGAKGKITRAFLDELQSEGIFYDPANCTKLEIETMRLHAQANGLRFMTREEFLLKVFYRLSYIKGSAKGIPDDTLPRLIIGHNLPFDLGAMSAKASPSRKRNYGGLTLTFASKRPGISVKKIGFGKHIYECGYSVNGRRTLDFLDTMQLGRAMLGPGGSAMEKMANRLGISDVEGKGEPDLGGPIDEALIQYCRTDVQRTWRIFEELRRLYRQHGVSRPIDRIYSPASVGKSYWEDLGVTPFLKQNPDFPRRLIGPFMEASYGGRSEVHIRLDIIEVLAADCKSQYPLVNVLMKLQELNIAERIDTVEDGPLGDAAQFLRNVTLEDMRQKETWPKLRGVGLVRPDGDILPLRTIYYPTPDQGPHLAEHDEYALTARAQQVGLNYIVSGPPTWYAFGHIIASKLLTGKCPDILQTIELIPVGVQSGLKTLNFFGDPEYAIDLRVEDFFRRVIEMRSETKNQIDNIEKRLAEDKMLAEAKELALELIRLGAMEKGLKLLANSTSFGMLIEFIVDEHKDPRPTSVWHGTSLTRKVARKKVIADDGGLEISGYKVERPGKWFAPWGPLIPAGGSLLLAIAERLCRDRGLSFGHCDTDGMTIARPKNMSRERFHQLAFEIAGPNGWFQALNPFRGGEPLFNLEKVNFHLENKKQLEPLYMLGVSAKRYTLANRGANGEWIIRKSSGHGLAHITAPEYDKTCLPQHPAAFKIEKDETSPLWFGVKGVWNTGELCNGENPKLFCDLWRIAFQAASEARPGHVREAIEGAIREALPKMPGLDAAQWRQPTLCGRAEWLAYGAGIPEARAFMFFALFSSPKADPGFSLFDAKEWKSAMAMADFDKRRADLMQTSLYAPIAPKTKDQPTRVELQSLKRRDNNETPFEIFDPEHGLRLQTVADALGEYFSHEEFKSRGAEGELERRKIVVLDHQYIGKETNPLIDPDDDEDERGDVHQAAGAPILQTGCNADLIAKLAEADNGEALAKAVQVEPARIRTIARAATKADAPRLNKAAMRALRAHVEVDDATGEARLVSGDERDPHASVRLGAHAEGSGQARQAKAHANALRRGLQILHDALAKGKDFDLDAPERRSALLNRRRGPVPLAELVQAIGRHIDPADVEAHARLEEGVAGVWWREPSALENFPQIERAIELASGFAGPSERGSSEHAQPVSRSSYSEKQVERVGRNGPSARRPSPWSVGDPGGGNSPGHRVGRGAPIEETQVRQPVEGRRRKHQPRASPGPL